MSFIREDNFKDIVYNIEDLYDIKVNEDFLKLLQHNERRYLIKFMTDKDKVISILEIAKKRRDKVMYKPFNKINKYNLLN